MGLRNCSPLNVFIAKGFEFKHARSTGKRKGNLSLVSWGPETSWLATSALSRSSEPRTFQVGTGFWKPFMDTQCYHLLKEAFSSSGYFFFLVRYFLYLHFRCYPKSSLYPPPALLPYPLTPTSWPWHSPVLGHIKFARPRGLSSQ